MNTNQNSKLPDNNLVIVTVIHKGRISTIYKCHAKDNKDKLVCVKSKRVVDPGSSDKEAKLLEKLRGITPALYFYNRSIGSDVIAMEYMGPSLHDLFGNANMKFSQSTIALIGLTALEVLESFHAEGYVHGHLEPRKILTDRNPNSNKLYLVGLSDVKKYRNDKGEHIRFKETQKATNVGSPFASVNAHVGIRLSRRDDIESLAYILLYFNTRGEIFDASNRPADAKDLCKWKLATPAELMHPKALIEFVQMLTYARSLKFEEKPNYERIQKMLKNVLQNDPNKASQGQTKYDWCTKADNNNTGQQVSEKRKALHNLLEFEKVGRFATILEDSREYLDSRVLDINPQSVLLDPKDITLSPQLRMGYNDMQITPKLESQQQPALKNRVVISSMGSHDTSNIQSPWNCSDANEEMASIIDKVKSLEFKTAMGFN